MRHSFPLTVLGRLGFALLLFLIGSAISLSAQGSMQGGFPSDPRGPFGAVLERRYRETALRGLRQEPAERRKIEQIDPGVLKQLNEDFKQIQIVRLGMIRVIQDGRPFEYKRLAGDAGEIYERAGRLKTFLAVSDKEDKNQLPFERAEFDKIKIQEAASALCLEISRFIGNPIFRSQGAYRARDAAEAIQTLDTIVNLSISIKNSAEKLRKK